MKSNSLKIHYDELGFITVRHLKFSPGFRSLLINGRHFCDFTPAQAAVLEFIFQYCEQGIWTGVHSDQILRRIWEKKSDREEEEE